MKIIRILLIISLGILPSACSWNELRPKPTHAPDIVFDHNIYRQTEGISELELRNKSKIESNDHDSPVMSALPHDGGGVIGDVLLASSNNKEFKNTQKIGTEKPVEFDFNDIDLRDLLKLFFDEYLKKPYTYLDDFKDKKVNFVFHGNVTHAEILNIFEVFLNYHGVSLKYNNGVYAITSTANTSLTLPDENGISDTYGIFKLRYMNAQDFNATASLLLADKGSSSAKIIDEINTVFIKASQSEIAAIKQLQKSLDIAFFENKYLLIYSPKFLKVSAAKVLIEKYEHSLGSKAAHPKKRLEVETLSEESRLVIVASDKEAKNLVLQFLSSIDEPGPSERQMFQYPLSNQQATDIMSTVDNLLKAATKNSEPVNVIADKLTNSLFVMATAEEFAEISKLLKKIDYRIPAVHMDCLIAEVDLNATMGYGVEWYLNAVANGVTTDATLDMMKNAAVAAATGGMSLGAVSLTNNKYASLKLLASTTDFKMLSNPHLMVKNGATASISVGSNIAVPVSKTNLTSTAAGPNTQTNFNREDVALKMEIKPQISMEGIIHLTITLEDKTLQSKDDGAGNPTFLKRDLKTELITEDNQTVLLGGLIRHSESKTVKKTPWIGDIPYLGALFSNNDKADDATELFMLITPRLVLDAEGAQLVTKAIADSSNSLMKKFDKKPPLSDLDNN